MPWITRWPGVLLTGVWAFAEGTVFFLLPDIPLSMAAMYSPKRALLHWIALLAGATLAGALMFNWSSQMVAAREVVKQVPRVQAWMFDQAQKDLDENGVWGIVKGPAQGIPYKVYAVLAPGNDVPVSSFMAASIPARGWRPLLIWMGFSLLGLTLVRLGYPHWRVWICVGFWVLSTSLYWFKVG